MILQKKVSDLRQVIYPKHTYIVVEKNIRNAQFPVCHLPDFDESNGFE